MLNFSLYHQVMYLRKYPLLSDVFPNDVIINFIDIISNEDTLKLQEELD